MLRASRESFTNESKHNAAKFKAVDVVVITPVLTTLETLKMQRRLLINSKAQAVGVMLVYMHKAHRLVTGHESYKIL